jgi:hypothetical protein
MVVELIRTIMPLPNSILSHRDGMPLNRDPVVRLQEITKLNIPAVLVHPGMSVNESRRIRV